MLLGLKRFWFPGGTIIFLFLFYIGNNSFFLKKNGGRFEPCMCFQSFHAFYVLSREVGDKVSLCD